MKPSQRPHRRGGIVHTYQKYDPKRFPSPTQPAPDIVSGAFEHWLIISLLIALLAHAAFMSQSSALFDGMFDATSDQPTSGPDLQPRAHGHDPRPGPECQASLLRCD